MGEEIKEPEDLGLKIGSKEEAAWTKVLKAQEEAAINSKVNLKISNLLIKLAEREIAKEKEKFKKT